jgi:DNA-binding Lrp family transcriptional regulator
MIQSFVVRVNPVIFGYEKECILTMRRINKKIKEDDILNRLNLLGDVFVYAKQLGGAFIFVLAVKAGAEEKIGLLIDLLKPAIVETRFVDQKPVSMNVNISDLKIIKCLLSNARMEIADIAREASVSSKTVTRRIEKMQQNHILEFTILRDMSSMQLVGYIEFAVVIKVDRSVYQYILKRIYRELQEYLMFVANVNQSDLIFAVFFCANISTVDSILTQIASYDGVEEDEVFITTKLAYYQEWLKREINKRLGSEAVATTRTRKYLVKEIRNKKTNGGEKNMMIAKPVSR